MKIARWQIYIICSYLLFLLYFIIGKVFFLKFYLQSLFEDRYAEWAQFYLLIFSSVLCFKLARDIGSREKHIDYFYILFGAFCMLLAMDEISWGQRILGFEVPHFFKHYNVQKETEFHNVIGKYLDYDYLIGLHAIIYGIALPMVVSYSRKSAAIFHRLNLVIPPRVLLIGFLFGAFFIMGLSERYGLNEEIGELFLYISLFYFLLIKWDERKKSGAPDQVQISLSRTIVKFGIFILFVAIVSTVMTDLRGHRGLTNYHRVYAIEYLHHGFSKEAVELYEKALGIKPDSQNYSFLKNLSNASIEIPSLATLPISGLDINGDLRVSLFGHPPSKISYEITIPEKSVLSFGIAFKPQTWSPDKGDGVLFELYVQDGIIHERVFSKYIDPKHNIDDRKWHDEVVDLSRYGGKEVRLTFVTTPGFNDDSDFDWAVWSDPRLVSIEKGLSQ